MHVCMYACMHVCMYVCMRCVTVWPLWTSRGKRPFCVVGSWCGRRTPSSTSTPEQNRGVPGVSTAWWCFEVYGFGIVRVLPACTIVWCGREGGEGGTRNVGITQFVYANTFFLEGLPNPTKKPQKPKKPKTQIKPKKTPLKTPLKNHSEWSRQNVDRRNRPWRWWKVVAAISSPLPQMDLFRDRGASDRAPAWASFLRPPGIQNPQSQKPLNPRPVNSRTRELINSYTHIPINP